MWKVAVLLLACACGGAPARPVLSASAIEQAAAPGLVDVIASETKRSTGFVVEGSGLIVTQLHIVEGESAVRVRVRGEDTEYPATLVASDAAHGIALLRISPPRTLATLKLGDTVPVPGARIYDAAFHAFREGSLQKVQVLSPTLEVLQVIGNEPDHWNGAMLDVHGEVVGISAAVVRQPDPIVIGVPVRYVRELMKRR